MTTTHSPLPQPAPCRTALTADRRWQFRARREASAHPWRDTLVEAFSDVTTLAEPLDWFGRWLVWRAPDARGPFEVIPQPPSLPDNAVEQIAVDGVLDVVPVCGLGRNGRTAFAVHDLHLDRDKRITLHVSADWWTQFWLDGRPIFDTLQTGNLAPLTAKARSITLDIPAGLHRFVARVISGNGGWALAAEAQRVAPAPVHAMPFTIEARKLFFVEDPSAFASITFLGTQPHRVRLNGQPVGEGRSGVIATRIAGLSPRMLRPGHNELRLDWTEEESARAARVATIRTFAASGDCEQIRPSADVIAFANSDAAIEIGPTLGHVTTDGVSLVCQLNLPVPLRWSIGGHHVRSTARLLHHLRITGLSAGTSYGYRVCVDVPDGKLLAEGTVSTLPAHGTVRIAVTADAGPLPAVWGQVAGCIAASRPHLLVFTGDLVSYGRREQDWLSEFFQPAAPLLSHVPLYPVLGNHDESSPLFEDWFITPGGRNWSQQIGAALLVGIDGAEDWRETSANYRWLDGLLSGSSAPFVLLFNHYPAWSSGPHLRTDPHGVPVEQHCRTSRDQILPLCQKHRVTAMFSGHDHCYERSDLPSGVALLTTGGAGAFLYERGENMQQNPNSRVFASAHHYCLLEVSAEACEAVARDVDGKLLDHVILQPRWLVPALPGDAT